MSIEDSQPAKRFNMATPLTLQTIFGLYGPNSPSVPILGDKATLNLLARDVAAGLHIVDAQSEIGLSESSHAIEMSITGLQLAGRIPMDFNAAQSLSDEQREAVGFEPKTLHPSQSMQHIGNPPFKELDVAVFIAALRFAARCQQLKSDCKPVFQVGIVTMTAQGYEKTFFAQTIQAESGDVTDTIWLYRWVIVGYEGEYDEHWRPFDINVDDGAMSPQPPQQHPQFPQQTAQYPPIAEASSPSIPPSQQQTPPTTGSSTKTSTPKRKRKRNPQHQTPPSKRPRRPQPYEQFDPRPLSDDALFAKPSSFIQGDAILRLAERYSNSQILARIEASHPGEIKAANVITKRLSNAIDAQAKKEGVDKDVVRARIYDAKEANGVAHKAKLDVTPYG